MIQWQDLFKDIPAQQQKCNSEVLAVFVLIVHYITFFDLIWLTSYVCCAFVQNKETCSALG